MRVAVYYSNDDVRLEQRPRPKTGPDELLLRVRASGICGSDVLEWYRRPRAPLVLGHEVAGTIEQAGERVSRFKVGDRVVATHHVPCNACRYCLSDRHTACEMLHATQFEPGGFSELALLGAAHVDRGTFHLPQRVSFEEGSFVEPLACALRGQRLAGVRAGDSVAVLGSGVAGLLHVQLARLAGAARIVATDVVDYRLAAARRLGADATLAPGDDLLQRLLETNAGRRADRVLVCTAARPAMEAALRLVDDGGTVLFFAPLAPGELLAVALGDLWRRGVSLVHSYGAAPAELFMALDLIAQGRIDVASMVTHRLPLELAQQGFRLVAAARESLKVILEP